MIKIGDAAKRPNLKNNESIRNFMKTCKEEFTLLEDWYFDKDAIMNFWFQISPNCIFIDYDEEIHTSKMVLPTFLQSVNLPQSFDSKDYFLNQTHRYRFFDRFLPGH